MAKGDKNKGKKGKNKKGNGASEAPTRVERKAEAQSGKRVSAGFKTNEKQKPPRRLYESELQKLQVELVKLQEWVRHKGLRVVVIFEGRDAAGKGGVIKRIA